MKDSLIICPNDVKINILKDLEKEKGLHHYHFMSKESFFNKYFFSYKVDALYYLMKKYHFQIDACKKYLKHLYLIEDDKAYQNTKLVFLQGLKRDLMNNKFLEFSSLKDYSDIKVLSYYQLDKWEEKALSYHVSFSNQTIHTPVYEFLTMEEEVNFLCIKILELVRRGVDYSKIIICNVSSDYYYTMNRLFSYYHIPIEIPFRNSIIGIPEVKEFLKTRYLEVITDSYLYGKVQSILEELSILPKDSYFDEILYDRLKNTYHKNIKYKDSVKIKDLVSSSFSDDEYVFVIGFNQDKLPIIYKDIDYLLDSEKEEVLSYTTTYKNQREKELVINALSNIKNLTLSFKRKTPFQSFYPSSLIEELNLGVISFNDDNYSYSHLYNKIRLLEKLDDYFTFGEVRDGLELLYSTYQLPYQTYNNSYLKIDHDLFFNNIKSLSLSYTSIQSYHLCKFSYYLEYILKIDSYEEKFSSMIGNLFHFILSKFYHDDFDFSSVWDSFFSDKEVCSRDKILLVRIREECLKFLDILKEEYLLTGFNDSLEEQEIKLDFDFQIPVQFIGYVDKIMIDKRDDKTYYSVIDYKTGYVDTHLEPLKYGLNMQLPIYMFLIEKSNTLVNPIFSGVYYQNILFPYSSFDEKDDKKKFYLQGYSTDNIDVLSRFDSSYENSQMIKSLKYSEDKGFGTYSKILTENDVKEFISYTEKVIMNSICSILEGDFSINPKVYDGENISCKFCKFRDICFQKDKNIMYLDKVDDLSFLGGE